MFIDVFKRRGIHRVPWRAVEEGNSNHLSDFGYDEPEPLGSNLMTQIFVIIYFKIFD